MWLSGLSTSLLIKVLLVRSPVRAHIWVAGQVSSRRCTWGNHTLMFPSLSFSLFPPSKNKINKILKTTPLVQKVSILLGLGLFSHWEHLDIQHRLLLRLLWTTSKDQKVFISDEPTEQNNTTKTETYCHENTAHKSMPGYACSSYTEWIPSEVKTLNRT